MYIAQKIGGWQSEVINSLAGEVKVSSNDHL
jgi:hypothetical protein